MIIRLDYPNRHGLTRRAITSIRRYDDLVRCTDWGEISIT
jgi:hypothetical protein